MRDIGVDLPSFLRHMANPNNFNDATCERLRLAADACDALEASQARAAVLREALKETADWTPGYYDNRDNQCAQTLSDNARSALVTLDPAADRLLSERKILRKLSAAFASAATEDPVRDALLCYVMGSEALAALTALRDFDAQAGREGEG